MHVAVVDPGCQVPYYTHQLSGALARAGSDVTLVTAPLLYDMSPIPATGVDVRSSFGRFLRPVPGTRVPVLRRTAPRRMLRAAGYPIEVADLIAWCLAQRPDVVHLQWALAPPLDGAWARVLRRAGVPLVYTAHNVVPHEARPWHPAFHRWLHGGASRVIVHSRSTRDRVVALGGADPAAVRIVPMPADEPESSIGRLEARASLTPPIGPDVPLAVFFGHVRPYKGLDVLVRAVPRLLTRLPEARVLVCGPVRGGEAAVRRLREEAGALGVSDAIDLRPGYVPRETADACIAAADVVALPYLSASDSAVLAAARGHGRAVVATDVGALSEALAGGGGVVVPAGDPARLADALADVLARAELKERLEDESRSAAQAWTWDDAAEATQGVYLELAEDSTP